MMIDELNEDAYLNMSIFDVFKEADDDNTAGNDAGGNDAATGGDNAAGGNDDNSNNRDEDFDIDANLDTGDDDNAGDDTGGTDDTGTDDAGGGDDDSGSDIGGGGDSGNGEEEPVEANTDIFSSLTAEEQAIKIRELKNLFNNLYTSIDDNITKLDNLGTTEDNIQAVTKLTTCMYNLKTYISDYIQFIFPNKSYIENDISFNRFLAIIKSITTIMNDLYKKIEEGDDKTKS